MFERLTTCCSRPCPAVPPVGAARVGGHERPRGRCSRWAASTPTPASGTPPASPPPRCRRASPTTACRSAVQLVGRPDDEATLLSLAAQIEAERPLGGPPPAGLPRPRRRRAREVRIHDTLSGELRAAGAARARQGGHLRLRSDRLRAACTWATRGPSWCSRCSSASSSTRATRSTLVENVTDVNDKIYDAAREAGVPSAGAGARDDRPLRGGHRRPGARPPRPRAQGERDDRRRSWR